PNVEVKRVDMIDEDFKTGLTSSMAAGIPPDLWFSWGGGILKAQVDAGHVADLTDLLTEPWAKEVVPRSAVAQSTFYDKHYALPLTVWVGHFYVNRELFDKYGLEVPKEPWSWDEFKEAIETFKANGVIPITVGGKEKWELSFYYMYLVDRIGGSEIFRKTINRVAGYTFEDPTFVQAGVRAEELAQIPTDRGRTNNLRLGLLLMT
ncbi:extracellular solute-binding protein, partial [Candidatus Hakubella thermalkaliphila]